MQATKYYTLVVLALLAVHHIFHISRIKVNILISLRLPNLMENLEQEKICVNLSFYANVFWAINGRAALCAAYNIPEIKVSKLEPP
jgi:hypothetical protein